MGSPQPLGREKFYVPGSLMRVRLDRSNALAWGMGETADVMFSASPTFRLKSEMATAAEESKSSQESNGINDSTGSPGQNGGSEVNTVPKNNVSTNTVPSNTVQKIAWFDNATPLRSGWAWGQEHLSGGIAIAEAKVGSGHLVLFGPQILFRAQPHGTFRLLFNGIVRAGMEQERAAD